MVYILQPVFLHLTSHSYKNLHKYIILLLKNNGLKFYYCPDWKRGLKLKKAATKFAIGPRRKKSPISAHSTLSFREETRSTHKIHNTKANNGF